MIADLAMLWAVLGLSGFFGFALGAASEEGKGRRDLARLALASLVWPIAIIALVVWAKIAFLIWLVRTAR